MGKNFLVVALLVTYSMTAKAQSQIPVTPRTPEITSTETVVVDGDIFVSGEIQMIPSAYFDINPARKNGSSRRMSDIEQLVCSQVSQNLLAIGSRRSAAAYSTLVGKTILYSKYFDSLDLLEWSKGYRPSLEQVTVPENADLFFADLKDWMLSRVPVSSSSLNELKSVLVLGHITSVTCRRI